MNEAILEKIRKIQALADGATTEAEAATASAMVAALCQKHNLDIGAATLAVEEREASEARHNHDTSRYQPHWVYLSKACESMFGVGVYRSSVSEPVIKGGMVAGSDRKISIVFYGLKASVQAAEVTYRYLVASVEAMLSGWVRQTGQSGVTAFRSFRLGCAKRVFDEAEKLTAGRKQLMAASNENTALVLLESKLVKAHAAKMRLRTGRGFQGASNGDAYGAGYAAGGRVNIHGANSRMLS